MEEGVGAGTGAGAGVDKPAHTRSTPPIFSPTSIITLSKASINGNGNNLRSMPQTSIPHRRLLRSRSGCSRRRSASSRAKAS